MAIGFAESKVDPLARLRNAYRLCVQATANLERYRTENRPKMKADYFGRVVVDVRNIQAEIEAAGTSLKACVIIETRLTDELSDEKS